MKNLFISLSLATLSLLAVGCKKADDAKPDLTGTYNVYVNSVSISNGKTTSLTDAPTTITIKYGKSSKELLIDRGFVVYGKANDMILTMNGNSFNIDPQAEWYKGADGTSYTMGIIGDGAFADNGITLHFTINSTEKALGYKGAVTMRGKRQ